MKNRNDEMESAAILSRKKFEEELKAAEQAVEAKMAKEMGIDEFIKEKYGVHKFSNNRDGNKCLVNGNKIEFEIDRY